MGFSRASLTEAARVIGAFEVFDRESFLDKVRDEKSIAAKLLKNFAHRYHP
jgi:hypothetical protein